MHFVQAVTVVSVLWKELADLGYRRSLLVDIVDQQHTQIIVGYRPSMDARFNTCLVFGCAHTVVLHL